MRTRVQLGSDGSVAEQLSLWPAPRGSAPASDLGAALLLVPPAEALTLVWVAMNKGLLGRPVLDIVELAAGHFARTSTSTSTAQRTAESWREFAAFCAASGAHTLLEITPAVAEAYMAAYTSAELPPSASTVSGRRTRVRLLFNTLRMLGLDVGDPTLDSGVPPRDALGARPLTDEEVAWARAASLRTLVETRQPAIWAIGETGATTGEAARVRWADIDLEDGLIRLPGMPRKTLGREVPLTDWGRKQLERRKRSGVASLVTSAAGEPEARRIATGAALSEILSRAGLTASDVRPSSLRGWAGATVFSASGRIEDVARHLGCQSLDAAAKVICFEWQP